MGSVVDVQEFLVVSPNGSGLTWPRLLDAEVARNTGTHLDLVLKHRDSLKIHTSGTSPYYGHIGATPGPRSGTQRQS